MIQGNQEIPSQNTQVLAQAAHYNSVLRRVYRDPET